MVNDMALKRPFVLSIAGTDPSSGAGVFADLKALEAHQVYGLGVVSALTCQSDKEFFRVDWVPAATIIAQADAILQRFPVALAKIGLVQDLEVLKSVIAYLQKAKPGIKIIWDPILQASAGYIFHGQPNEVTLKGILNQLYLVTPNVPEAGQLAPAVKAEDSARELSQYCHVLLKGGHQQENPGRDQLWMRCGQRYAYRPRRAQVSPKHGSGCVLSAAIAANLAQGFKLPRAVLRAKQYTTRFLSSNPSLLGYHG
jgi:hydroxymethylpyrimidine/phosphomethylpyrimidine kinase